MATASSPMLQDPPSDRRSAIGELIRGRELAVRLVTLLREGPPGGSATAGALIDEVLGSFSRALGALESPAAATTGGENSGRKRKIGAAGSRGSGCRKRRQAFSTKIVKSKTTGDEFSWRKYGQKDIQSAVHPRSYFRCTNKHDQGCKATKQVQKSEEDPSLYIITYIGEHTCRDPAMFITDYNTTVPSLISFGSNASSVTQELLSPSSSFPSQRQECDEEVLSNAAPSDYFVMSNLYGERFEHGDVTSGMNSSTGSLDVSFMVDPFAFGEDVLSFDDHGDLFRYSD